MLRLRSNCSVTRADPVELVDVISLTPAIVPSRRSSGVATLLAMVSGLAPARLALTEMTGKSTLGSGETGRTKYAAIPASAMPMVKRIVAIGRSTKGFERFMRTPSIRCGLVLFPLPPGEG